MQSKEIHHRSIKLGVSSCLLGEKSRYNSGHKRNAYIADILGQYFQFVAICPELEVGMDVPREPVRLMGAFNNPKLIGVKTGTDWTERMNKYARRRVSKADLKDISGYILKEKSPSCGGDRVKVYGHKGTSRQNGVGLFAAALMKRFPYLPMEEEGRLEDAAVLENFITRIFAYNRLQQLHKQPFSRQRMTDIHTAHKYLLLAHHPEKYRQLSYLTEDVKNYLPTEFKEKYQTLFMQILMYKATVKKNVIVLQRMAGCLKNKISVKERQDLASAIEKYHRELVQLKVPLTLIRNLAEKYEIAALQSQVYLNPHPQELLLRNLK
ncbi:MAG: DUF1722 domain-containing protein [FCB group bacterium]|nr:DUF1722 domain-containing protein [FCB group bacterium]